MKKAVRYIIVFSNVIHPSAILTPLGALGKVIIIGSGSVVTLDIPDRVTAVGVPAKIISSQPLGNWITQSGDK